MNNESMDFEMIFHKNAIKETLKLFEPNFFTVFVLHAAAQPQNVAFRLIRVSAFHTAHLGPDPPKIERNLKFM